MSRRLVLPIFILSGAAGLIYEVVWSRQLVLVFGNTTQAVSAILTGFFGGMAVGNAVGGRIADRVARPLRLYGGLEIAIAAIAIATPILFRLSLEVYRGAFGSLERSPELLALVRFGLALLALGPATVLLGATLPTLTRYLARDAAALSGSFAGLYAANTLGAVGGAAVSGFVLIELLGLSGALGVGAACSALAGLTALAIDAWQARAARRPAAVPPAARRGSPQIGRGGSTMATGRLGLALGFAFVSGLTALGYQTLWTRLLASGTGNSTYVFALILVVFLAGLALGSALFAGVRPLIRSPVVVLALCQAAIAVFAVWGLVAVIGRPPEMSVNLDDIDGVWSALWPQVLLVVLPPTLVMGFALPVAAGLLGATDHSVGGRTGLLLGFNTLGSIVGTFVIPFFVIPALGSPASVVVLAIANVATALALVAAPAPGQRLGRTVAATASALAAAAVVVTAASPGTVRDPGVARIEDAGGRVFASTEDEIASVQAGDLGSPQLWVTGTSMTALTVDTRLMPVLSLALRPHSARSLVVAFGMGSAYRSSLRAGLETDAVELVPSVPAMFPWFFPDAKAVLADPRGRVIVADGRNYVELTNERYDIIVVDPPPPIYSSGVSVISSLEFYRAAHDRLNRGGVMMQWVPYGQTTDEYRAHVRTYASVFSHLLIVRGPAGYGTYMFGSDDPLAFDPATLRQVLARPGVLDDLSAARDTPTKTIDGWLKLVPGLVYLSDDGARAFAGSGPLITDDRPLPEYFLLRHLAKGR